MRLARANKKEHSGLWKKYVPCILKYVRPISKYVGHIFYRMESRIPTLVVAIKNRAAGISKISCRPVNGTEFIAIIPFCR